MTGNVVNSLIDEKDKLEHALKGLLDAIRRPRTDISEEEKLLVTNQACNLCWRHHAIHGKCRSRDRYGQRLGSCPCHFAQAVLDGTS